MKDQPWIGNPKTDTVFILMPPFFSLLVIGLFPSLFKNNDQLPELSWIILVLLIDVAHVYSTLYRTYFDPYALKNQRSLLWSIPFFSFVSGVIVYSISHLLFWRILAYIAVFHFVRQQYGFMRVYSRKDLNKIWFRRIDTITIYSAALYPIIYWHLSGPKNFNWFIENDFYYYPSNFLLTFFKVVYILILLLYFSKEIYLWVYKRSYNLPKTAIIIGTIASWYFGIVYFNGDMAFTLLNVVSHGVPYIALVWLFGKKKYQRQERAGRFLKLVFSQYGLLLFLLIIFLFAFIEEGLWDIALWKEHKTIFNSMRYFDLNISEPFLNIIVPLLALPQITHYVLDGFIWKIRKDEFTWSNAAHPALNNENAVS